jgi:hypothetical protein
MPYRGMYYEAISDAISEAKPSLVQTVYKTVIQNGFIKRLFKMVL